MQDNAEQNAELGSAQAPSGGGETVARVMTGLNMLRGRAEQLAPFQDAGFDAESSASVNAAAIDIRLNAFIDAAERALERVIDSDANLPTGSSAGGLDDEISVPRAGSESGMAALPSMQCGLAALRLVVRTLVGGVDDFAAAPDDEPRFERLGKRLAHAEKTLGEFSVLCDRAEQEMAEQPDGSETGAALAEAAAVQARPADQETNRPVDHQLDPETDMDAAVLPEQPAVEQVDPPPPDAPAAVDSDQANESAADDEPPALGTAEIEAEGAAPGDRDPPGDREDPDDEAAAPVQAEAAASVELSPIGDSPTETAETDPLYEPSASAATAARSAPAMSPADKEEITMVAAEVLAATEMALEDHDREGAPRLQAGSDPAPAEAERLASGDAQEPEELAEAEEPADSRRAAATGSPGSASVSANPEQEDSAMADAKDSDPTRPPEVGADSDGPGGEPDSAGPSAEELVAEMARRVREVDPTLDTRARDIRAALRAQAGFERRQGDRRVASQIMQGNGPVPPGAAPGGSSNHAWWDGLERLKRQTLIGVAGVAVLALALFGLGWWLFPSHGETGGLGASSEPTGAALSAAVVGELEGRLGAIEGGFDAVEERLIRLEDGLAALAERSVAAAATETGTDQGVADSTVTRDGAAAPRAQDAPVDAEASEPGGETLEPEAAPSLPALTESPAVSRRTPVDDAAARSAAAAEAASADTSAGSTGAVPAGTQAPAETAAAESGDGLVLNSVRYGIQLGAFGVEKSAREFAEQNGAEGRSLYFYRSGPNGEMIAVIRGLYTTNQEVADDLVAVRREHGSAWPRRFDPGAELTLYRPPASD